MTSTLDDRAVSAVITVADLPLWITPMQAVAWVMTREAAVTLRASLDRFDVERASTALPDTGDLWPEQPGLTLLSLQLRQLRFDPTQDAYLETDRRAIKDLVAALRRGTVVASAEPYDRATNERGERKVMTTLEWAALTFVEHQTRDRHLTCCMDLSGVVEGRVWASQWASLLIDTASVTRCWPEKPRTTVADETSWRVWLIEQMKADPKASRAKADIKAAAEGVFSNVSGRGFNRAWDAALEAPGVPEAWGRSGRKSKR